MEQKTFLAIVLSFIFLLSYNALIIAPQQKVKQTASSKVPESQSVKENLTPLTTESVASSVIKDSIKSVHLSPFIISFHEANGIISRISFEKSTYFPPLTAFTTVFSYPQLINYRESPLLFIYKDSDTQLTKKLVSINPNQLKVYFQILNLSKVDIHKSIEIVLFDIDLNDIKEHKEKMRDNMLFEYSTFSEKTLYRKSNAYRFSPKENKVVNAALTWAGWRDRYHFTVVKPLFKTTGFSINSLDEHKLRISTTTESFTLTPGEAANFEANIFIGPQDHNLLKNLDPQIEPIMAFSRYGFLDFIEKSIYKTLLFMNKFVNNWGVCIILISLFIYGLTYPLTIKSMLSMRKMQELQPKMAELREKYKNNPQKLNEEVVQLYRIHNVNPLSGCLPIFLQMPVFISLYQVLWRTYNFQGASFLWIRDLSEPDKLFILPKELPFIGNEVNILPVLMAIVMFFQQKVSSRNIIVTDPSQQMQQKMMQIMMPIFIGGIFYHFASGLTLYFTVFYCLSTLTQYKMSKIRDGK